jgi:hypothetical protein
MKKKKKKKKVLSELVFSCADWNTGSTYCRNCKIEGS